MVDTRIFETEDTHSGVYFVYFVHEAIFHGKTADFKVIFTVIGK